MKKRLNWTEWKEPHLAKAKRLDIKLSNKNLKRLNSRYLGYCFEYDGINAVFAGIYEEHIQALVQQSFRLPKLIDKLTN